MDTQLRTSYTRRMDIHERTVLNVKMQSLDRGKGEEDLEPAFSGTTHSRYPLPVLNDSSGYGGEFLGESFTRKSSEGHTEFRLHRITSQPPHSSSTPARHLTRRSRVTPLFL